MHKGKDRLAKDQKTSVPAKGRARQEKTSVPAPWPLYQQVKNLILRRITSGHWPPGSKVPSEHELVEMLGISRMTINRAIRELTTDGHLYRQRGAGTFVKEKKPQFALFEIRSIAEEIKSWGGRHSSEVVCLERVKAADDLLLLMGLEEKSEIYHSLLVHRDKKVPIQIAERFVNPIMAPEFINQDFTRITPSDYLLKSIPPTEIEHVIETRLPDLSMQKLLQIPATEPCLVLHRTTWFEKQVASKNRFIYPGSRYTLGGRFKTSAISTQSPV